MINLRLYTEVLKQDIPDDHEGLSILRGIVIGYLTRVIYNKQEGIEKAIEEATKFVEDNWEDIVNDWNNNLEYKEEEEKLSNYASLTKLYE